MRALLVVNPSATTTSPRTREVLVRALGSEIELEVAQTDHRGHAFELGRRAATERMDVVVSLGGDGTVNEVVNGLLSEGPRRDLPHLAVVPGGSSNVFARAVGLPRDPVEATGAILDALRDGSRRTIGLRREKIAGSRHGRGRLDAEVVPRGPAPQRRGIGTPEALCGTALRSSRETTIEAALTFTGGRRPDRRRFVIVANSSPGRNCAAHAVTRPRPSFER